MGAPPASTISVGGIVKFNLEGNHNVVPHEASGMTDPGLTVTFHFKCLPHSFKGTITVQ